MKKKDLEPDATSTLAPPNFINIEPTAKVTLYQEKAVPEQKKVTSRLSYAMQARTLLIKYRYLRAILR